MTVEHEDYRQRLTYPNVAALFDDKIAGLVNEHVRDGDNDMKEDVADVLRRHAHRVDPNE